ncbi:MAG: hypothetical protein ACYC35_06925 [Pirellulales bacterium]
MRLTLRTLLAYLDDILEPADAEDLGKRIEESEVATGLVHRTRDVMRRLRLGAPKLEGPGMGLDPNTVAEYLDNTLAPERVPDFEKVCLESDSHLAEVASCHQILTLVLGEPADVDPASRQRMYSLAGREQASTDAAATPAVVQSKQAPPPVIEASSKAKRERPEVPAYLRERSGRRWLRPAAALAVVVLVAWLALAAGGVLPSHGLFGGDGPLAGLFGSPDTAAEPESGEPATGAKGESAEEPAAEPEPLTAAEAKKSSSATKGTESPAKGKATSKPVAPPAEKGQTPPKAEASAEPPEPPVPEEPVAKPPAATGDVPKPAKPPKKADVGAASPPVAAKSVAKSPSAAEGIGRFVSDEQMLLRFDPAAADWRRVPARATLFPGDRLLSLPTFRPTVTLSAGLTLTLVGGTLVEFEPADRQGTPGVAVIYGRLVLMTVGKPDARIRLRLANQTGTIVFGDAEATTGVEVRRVLVDGANPETEPAHITAELYAASGKVSWETAPPAAAELLESPGRKTLVGAALKPAGGEAFPKWVAASETLDTLERQAAATLEQAVQVDRSATLSLKELADHRRVEIRSLAASCLCQIREFTPSVNVLNDPNQRAAWSGQIDALRDALTLGPDVAAQVREALAAQRGAKGAELYRMLYGYTEEELKSDAARRLVGYLDHPDLDFRVLSSWNLQRITGLTNLGYRADYIAQKRKPPIQRWKQKLQDGLIVPKSASDVPPVKTAPPVRAVSPGV